MKKILAMLLAVMMLLSVASVAMAEPTDAPATPDYTDQQTVTITKIYERTNAGTKSPAEEFKFTIERKDVSDAAEGITAANMPLPTIGSTSYVEGEAGAETKSHQITINLPEYSSVGIYTYTIKETAGNTAGVEYYGDDILLKVTVIEQNGKIRVAAVHTEKNFNGTAADKTKKDSFTNTYSAGKLSVTKTVAGNLGDQSKKFDFTVKFTKPANKEVKSTITAKVAGANVTDFNPVWDEKGEYTYTFKLAHDETATFENLPYGVTYTVTETAVDGYTTTQTNENGTINSAEVISTFTNTKTGTIDMGVMLDSMPYVLVLAVVGAAVIALIAKKRRVED